MSKYHTNIIVEGNTFVKASKEIETKATAECFEKDPKDAKEILAKNEINNERKKTAKNA